MKHMTNEEIKDLLRLAYDVAATESDDPSTQNGAVLLTCSGRVFHGPNRFPRGVRRTDERLKRPLKYSYISHSERNVILQAAREGVATEGATLVCPWAACGPCAQAIVDAGIKKVVTHGDRFLASNTEYHKQQWDAEVNAGDFIMSEGGVEVVVYRGPVGGRPILVDGKLWQF